MTSKQQGETTQEERVIGRPFKPGNPGRPKGSRNKLGEKFLKDLLKHWKQHGTAALDGCLEKDPAAYCRVVASILPKEIKLDANPLDKMNDAELVERYLAVSARIAAALGGTRPSSEDDRPPEAGNVSPLH